MVNHENSKHSDIKFNEWLIDAMRALDLQINETATLVGVSPLTIRRWLRDETKPPLNRIGAVVKSFLDESTEIKPYASPFVTSKPHTVEDIIYRCAELTVITYSNPLIAGNTWVAERQLLKMLKSKIKVHYFLLSFDEEALDTDFFPFIRRVILRLVNQVDDGEKDTLIKKYSELVKISILDENVADIGSSQILKVILKRTTLSIAQSVTSGAARNSNQTDLWLDNIRPNTNTATKGEIYATRRVVIEGPGKEAVESLIEFIAKSNTALCLDINSIVDNHILYTDVLTST